MAFLVPAEKASSPESVLMDRRSFLRAAVLAAACAACPVPLQAQDPSYRIKAVFLYNFAQFVTWPESAFAALNAPFVIGVLGRDPFGTILDETIRGESVSGRKLEVRRYQSGVEVIGCQILFISMSEATKVPAILDELNGRPVLTVGETENFATQGGMVRFVSDRNKIRFRINPQAAERAGLVISSKLLRLADIVTTERRSR